MAAFLYFIVTRAPTPIINKTVSLTLRYGPQISLYKEFHWFIMMSSEISLVPFKNVATILVFPWFDLIVFKNFMVFCDKFSSADYLLIKFTGFVVYQL